MKFHEQFQKIKIKNKDNKIEKPKTEERVKNNPELTDIIHETYGFNKKIESVDIKYLYHRTKKEKAKSILANGFRLKPDTANRIESGNGIYTVTSLEDINNSYNKKHYGNYIVRIGYDNSKVKWEYGEKVDFMKLAKEDNHGDRRYHIKNVGEVAVFHSIDKIVSIEISKDNGKTWEKSLLYDNLEAA